MSVSLTCVCVSCCVSFCCVLFVVTGVVVLLFGMMGDVVLLFVIIVVECVSMVGLCCIVGNVIVLVGVLGRKLSTL